ncbi:MAG: hydrogenase maturation nickel metallochaperone HypA [Deltaproteobacteria bacterium]|nr:hydrogenase maturation nickel metallochaperone HypA [Deltaproteobacteria bacterium]
MHEVSIMMSIIDTALDVAKQNDAQKITKITVEIGEKAGVVKDALEFAFETVTKETIATQANFEIITIPFKGQCISCDHIFTGDNYLVCDKCGNLGKMITGNELRIKSIEVDECV